MIYRKHTNQFIPKMQRQLDGKQLENESVDTLQTHLLQFAMDHKFWQTAEGQGRSATSEHLWVVKPFSVLRHQSI